MRPERLCVRSMFEGNRLRNQALAATALLLALGAVLLAQQLTAERASAAKLASKTFTMSGADEKGRLVLRCPGRMIPLGGGMRSDPPPSEDGEGVYPHSYERLGVQSGWHVTAVLFDPSR